MAVQSVVEITNQIIAQIRAGDPSISCEVGTPERKIVEAVAEQIAQSQIDLSVLDSQHDLDTMSGSRLDAFAANFGFGRKQATRATGFVTFSRSTAATSDILVPLGTQVLSRQTDAGFPSVVFVTTESAVLATGDSSVTVRVESTVPGSLADIPANAITTMVNVVAGITTVTNDAPIGGGTDGEDDASFKVRIKNTIFRNQAGTYDQYLSLAVSLPGVSKSNVVGPISRYQEYVQIPMASDAIQIRNPFDPTGFIWPLKRSTAVSTIPYSKFTYDGNYYLTDGSLDSGAGFYRPGVDYVFNNPRWANGDAAADVNGPANFQPNITALNVAGSLTDPGFQPGVVLLFEHSYMSSSSRNDFSRGVTNCVDVFVDGENETSVSSLETLPLSNSSTQFIGSPVTALNYSGSFTRLLDGSAVVNGHLMEIVFWQPMLTLPDSIQVGDNFYFKANFQDKNSLSGTYLEYFNDEALTQRSQYWEIYDNTELYGTTHCRNGIEWDTSVAGVPVTDTDIPKTVNTQATGTQFQIDGYTFDQNISDLQAIMEKNKQITSDVLVHKAKKRYLKLYLTLMYSVGANESVVNSGIVTALDLFYHTQYFGAAIQMSDLLQTVHNTPGVDNVRWSNEGSHPTAHRVEEVNANGSSFVSPIFQDDDFFLKDHELVFVPDISTGSGTDTTLAVVIRKRAQNTWGT